MSTITPRPDDDDNDQQDADNKRYLSMVSQSTGRGEQEGCLGWWEKGESTCLHKKKCLAQNPLSFVRWNSM